MSKTHCKICHRSFKPGDEAIRVETFTVSDSGTEGTIGWSSTNHQFVHLNHLTAAYLATLKDPGKGKW